ncbi:MAG: 2-amino-4-hydroxy-6-hydroxymethyldihydropteridine diphosphokinase [Prevotella sp.]|nr:2-amino-4-hydroxy-6-hydroxymethyldihydropteridine diphosphokinase [Prevotella sp.]
MISYLSLGTNLGDRRTNLLRAIDLLDERAGRVLRCSSFVETEPSGFVSEHMFLNACIALDTPLSPRELLCATQEIERLLGRTEKTAGHEYKDRLIDIDILTYGDDTIDIPGLHIPHPRMHERDFVMIPLREITT